MIEVTTFRLGAGVSASEFIAADANAQVSFFNLQPGMLRRTTARADDGGWISITLWSAGAEADAASAAASADAACGALTDLIDDTSVEVRRYTELD